MCASSRNIAAVGRITVLLAATALLLTPLADAVGGKLDATFDRDGKVVTDFGADDLAEDVVVQPDGKIVVIGGSYSPEVPATSAFVLARYRANGSLDPSFGSAGKVRTALGSANAVALQRDGKIVVAGLQLANVAGSIFAVSRYGRDGTVDPTFGSNGVVLTDFGSASSALGVAVQPDGKIVAVGHAGGDFAAARYLPTGALDRTFDSDGRLTTAFTTARDVASDLALQQDGKIVAGGVAGWRSFPGRSPPPDFAVARYNSDGSLDSTFDEDGKTMTALDPAWRAFGHDVAIQADGKVLLAGGPIVRYRRDGRVDSSFGVGGTFSLPNAYVQALVVQRNRKLIAVGTTMTVPGDFVVIHLRADGRADSRGRVATDFARSSDGAQAAVLQRDGKLVVAGTTGRERFDFAVARYLGNPPARCIVPNVRGRTVRAARARIRRASCSVGLVTRASSRRIRGGRVISQTPRPGTRLRAGGKVRLVVSRG
jgi:uncharacterized delta-60 repeat protein